MADICDVIRADGTHILCWQTRLGQLRRGPGSPAGPDLAVTWDTVTALIDLHGRAEEEICDPAIYRPHLHGRILAGQARDYRRLAGRELRAHLASQWRAFNEAAIRDRSSIWTSPLVWIRDYRVAMAPSSALRR